VLPNRVTELAQQQAAVVVVVEDRLPVVAAYEDVVGMTGKDQSRLPCHLGSQ
jgi:hypothetical protein